MNSYEQQDRERLGPARQKVRDYMFGSGFYTLAQVSKATGVKEGTVGSSLREFNSTPFSFLGLAVDKRRVEGVKGLWEYQLRDREPAQLPLLEFANAHS